MQRITLHTIDFIHISLTTALLILPVLVWKQRITLHAIKNYSTVITLPESYSVNLETTITMSLGYLKHWQQTDNLTRPSWSEQLSGICHFGSSELPTDPFPNRNTCVLTVYAPNHHPCLPLTSTSNLTNVQTNSSIVLAYTGKCYWNSPVSMKTEGPIVSKIYNLYFYKSWSTFATRTINLSR